MRKELWYLGLPKAKASAKRAGYLEAHGWDGLMFPDTQCIANEVYIEMAMCVAATTKLKFSTGVTNPITRDCSVMASMLATLQEESNGRMRVGIGRGDSAAAHIGKKGASLKEMREFLANLQDYLGGKSVTRDGAESRLLWLDNNQMEKVPVDIAGTGPKMIEMAALLGDGICLAVGGNTQRISAKVKLVEEILDRVGGGDSFASGLIYGFLTSGDPEQAVNYGAAHGALAMTTPGDTSMATLKEVEKLMSGGGARVVR